MSGPRAGCGDVREGIEADLTKPDVIKDTMAFMFETRAVIRPTQQAMDAAHRQRDYQDCWAGLKKSFVAPR
jgi:homogentisate 1,2-dioxygenase